MPSPVGIFKIRLAASAFWNCSDRANNLVEFLNSGVLFVNGELRVADDVDEQNCAISSSISFLISADMSVD